jgi:hypothetical protein
MWIGIVARCFSGENSSRHVRWIQHPAYLRDDAIGVRENVVVPEADDRVASGLQRCGSRRIRFPIMLAAIGLDDQLRIRRARAIFRPAMPNATTSPLP